MTNSGTDPCPVNSKVTLSYVPWLPTLTSTSWAPSSFEGSKSPPLATAHGAAFFGVAASFGLLVIVEGVGSGLVEMLAEMDGEETGLGAAALPSVWAEPHAVSPIRPTIRAIGVFL